MLSQVLLGAVDASELRVEIAILCLIGEKRTVPFSAVRDANFGNVDRGQLVNIAKFPFFQIATFATAQVQNTDFANTVAVSFHFTQSFVYQDAFDPVVQTTQVKNATLFAFLFGTVRNSIVMLGYFRIIHHNQITIK
ncbi:hypothetical protein T05_9275 [Trichinella murrelli]|uniref:Uncharacterized protein n=1 Tax=Trichinella murrelli TaxID=144512 RepID=A0A0V0TJW6_9BILA|nr:hypothetical protein T05_9275 [Trichinella murrelli]